MIKKLQKRFALSEQGAKDLIKGCFGCVIQNLTLMFPVGLLYRLVTELMNGTISKSSIPFYVVGCLLCLTLIFIAALIQYNTTYLATYTESRVRRIAIAEKLRKLPLSFFGKKDLADLTSAIMNDCTFLETSFSHYIPELIGSIISTTLIAVCLLFIDWRMALSALWVLPVAFAIAGSSRSFKLKLDKKQMDTKIACADGIQECIEAVRDLQSNNADEAYLKELDLKIKAVERRSIITELGTAVFAVTAQLVLKLGIATVSLTGAVLLNHGSLSVLVFFMFLLIASRLYDPLLTSLNNLMAVISTHTNINRMNEILYHEVQDGSENLKTDGYDILFDNVGFSYNKDEAVLTNVSFTAKQGDVTALVGPSGGGKTTVSRLAARFWDANTGRITVGGADVKTIDPETLLSVYSIVFQDVTLFNNTIAENIRIGKRDATDEEVMRAAHLANCDEFAQKLPNGYDTLIGENGCELSGGERQRVSIARAFLKDAPIILLDEATASLDVENETLIQSALSRLIKDKTVLVIAHRMRTVSGADKIVVISGGTAAEQGTPQELMRLGGIFSHMVKAQQG